MTRITRRKLPGNWDGTLTGDMINYTENRDSIGFDAKTNRWYAPEANKGYDSNQRGMGVDINTNQYVKEFLKKDERGVYLTKEDERYIKHKSLDDAFDSYNDRVSHAKKIIQVNKDPSEIKKALTINAIYNLGTGTVANELFEDKALMSSLLNGTDEEYAEHVIRYFVKHKKKERPELIRKFMRDNKYRYSKPKPKLVPRTTTRPPYDWNLLKPVQHNWMEKPIYFNGGKLNK